MVGQPNFGDCLIGPGQLWPPSNTNLGISTPESEFLGNIYWGRAKDGSVRCYKIVKNADVISLTKGYVLVFSTSTGRFGLDVLLSTGDTDAPAGVVDDSYDGGVPVGKYFRMVVYAEKIKLKLGSTSNSRCTLTVGNIIVSNTDDGMIWAQNTAASNAAVQNRVGRSLVATTNGTENGTYIDCEVNLAF